LSCLSRAAAQVVAKTMPGVMREEPLLLAQAHYTLARAYQVFRHRSGLPSVS
jgi:hypothetical protein